jgi:hypothetical protein
MAYKQKELPELCERLKQIGYGSHKRVRIYGDELELTADPVASEDGVAVEGISRQSGENRKVSLPLAVVQMVTQGGRH